MKKKERVELVMKLLEEFFPHPEIPLQHNDPYTLLIAVLLSAQCTDIRVNLVTPHLFKRANTPEKMSHLSVEEIGDIIRSCGFWKVKSKAIHRLSEILVEKYGGKVPSSFEDLECLPGVGHKTASVVRISSFHLPAFPVDTHIFRCARRWGLSKGKNVREVEEDLKKVFPEKKWGILHLQIIYFARKYCPARGHQVESCPICSVLVPSD